MRSRLARWIDPEATSIHASSPSEGAGPQQPSGSTGTDGSAPGAPGTTALVIAGGGARSSFQVGALRYLYDRQKVTPSLISGTSAGSILGAVLAQYPDHAGQRRALDQLETIWLSMQQSSDMFAEQAWFSALRAHIPTWRKVMALRQRPANRVSLSEGLTDLLAKPKEAVQRLTAGSNSDRALTRGEPDPDVDEATERASALDEPAEPPTATPVDTPPEHEQTWTPAHALETLSTLWEAGRSSADLDFILRGAQEERSAFRPGPMVDQLLKPAVFSSARTAASGVDLRVALVSLETGDLRYVDGQGRMRDRADQLLDEHDPVEVMDAVRASCAIPGVFPPVRLDGEHYVDGGVRENVPAQVALETGPDTCYVVVASPSGVAAESSYADKDLMAIMLRTTAGIMTDEVQRDELSYARAAGAVVIQPELDIHDLVTIDPGLVSIAMDYGYLRAGDVCENADDARIGRTHEIIQLRRLIWTVEDELFNPATADAGTTVRLQEVTDLKQKLRDLLQDPGSAHLPPSAQQWWQVWERHPFTIEYAPTWLPEDDAATPSRDTSLQQD